MTVKAIQQALKAAGFDPGPIDGIRGPRTIAAVKAYQAANGLVVDGIVGPKTTASLSGATAAASPAAAGPTIDTQILAAQYGFAQAVLNSDAELKSLFDRAVAQTFTQERFTAELRSTKWYQSHGETWRNATILKAADPASYAANVSQVQTRLGMMAAQLGAVMTNEQIAQMAETSYQLGWDDNQIEQNLSTYVQFTDGRMLGQAGQWEQELRTFAADMGITVSNETLASYVKAAAGGMTTIDDQKGKIREMAVSAFPHLADRLRSGDTLRTIADPYRELMASTFEVNPESLGLTDPTIRAALAAPGRDGQPALSSLYDFQNTLRQDTRWLKTDNARDAAMSTTRRVLKDFGFAT